MKAKKEKPKINKPLTRSSNAFPVVGVGASAGGLNAFKKLLKAIPDNSGMAYVLVQHLSPNQESLLPDLLQKVTAIPVLEITDDISVEPDHIYIIPANKMLIANDGVLQLSPRPLPGTDQRNLPIDLFFSSLAEVHQSHSIGVILSGTASDGTAGLKAIKDHGGITLTQDEESAEYKEMPRNAVHAGVVDFILSPEEIPKKLLQITQITKKNETDGQSVPQEELDPFKQILSLLRIRRGTDFTYYKQTTIRRRMLRRMVLNGKEEPLDYLKYLRENKAEQDALYQDLLIPVTSFFRDPQSFENLCQTVLPKILASKIQRDIGNEFTRVWVAGCSTGEEAYSIAICLKELSAGNQLKLQIFATDISEPAIAKARSGIYLKSEVEGVTPQRLREFFTKTNGHYQVNKDLRDTCVFAVHNFLKDPPFSKIDLITCRNVLIYMEPYLQKKALSTFHYALNSKGFLFLGKSESISPVPELFAALHKSDKLFSRKDASGRVSVPVISEAREQNLQEQGRTFKTENIRTDFQRTADDIILNKYTPAGIVVNEMMEIVHFRGDTSDYLQQPSGKPSHNLLKLAKNGLAFELRNILHKVKKEIPSNRNENQTFIKENILINVKGSQRTITIEALSLPDIVDPHYLILFHDTPSSGNKTIKEDKNTARSKLKASDKDRRIQQLEQELEQMHEDMRGIADDQEAAYEEVQSANEELQSGTEELRSLNEELETSKEELQSTNEELTVVNQQLTGLNQQVTEERNYADAIVTTVREPLLVLDKYLRVKTANKSFYKTFLVNEQETEGKPIYSLGNHQWGIPELRNLLENVLPQKETFIDFVVNHNFPSIGQRTMLLNAREILKDNGGEKLILLAIEDITERRIATNMLKESEERFRTLADGIPMMTFIVKPNAEGTISYWNKTWLDYTGQTFEEALGRAWDGIIHPDDVSTVLDIYVPAFEKRQSYFIPAVRVRRYDGEFRWHLFKGNPRYLPDGEFMGYIGVGFDVHDQKIAVDSLKESEQRFRNLVEKATSPICILKGEDMVVEVANEPVFKVWNVGKEALGKPFLEIIPEMKDQPFMGYLLDVFRTGITHYGNEEPAYFNRDNGERQTIYFNFVYQPYRENDGSISGVMVLATDVTEQVVARKKIEVQNLLFHDMLMTAPGFVATLSGPDHVFELVNEQYQSLFGKRKIQGKPLMEALPELEGQGFDLLLDKVYKTGEPYVGIDIPITLARDENLVPEERYFNFSYQPMYNENKGIFSILVFGYEVTDQVCAKIKNLESEHLRSSELKEKVEQRTLELSGANEALTKMNKELESFNYISSHDLQEPLRKIQTFATKIEEMESKNLSAKGKDYFQRMKDSAHRMQTLIQDLLSYSRTANTERRFIETDLQKVAEEVKDDLKEIIQEKNAIIEMRLRFQARIIPFQFRQLIYNLISNALKFSRIEKPPHIILKDQIATGELFQNENPALVNRLMPEKKYYHFTISDNGIGFEPKYKEQIFEVFQRLFLKDEYPGTGIGLSIVKKIVENHNGIITATGELEKGASFDIYIPA